MQAIHRNKITPFGVMLSSFTLLAAFAGAISVSHASAASEQATAPNGRILTIHDRGNERVVLTKASTLKDALAAAGVTLDKNDSVEPGLGEKLVATDYQVNIYRARPVIVVDGATRQKIMTPYQTPAQIAKDAGVSLYDEDVTSIDRTTNIVAEGAGITMTVARATPFTLTMYGKKIDARTQAKTVGDMLAQKNIKLAANDTLSVDSQAPITAGMTIELWRNGTQTITEDQAIPFDIQKIQDADHDVGYREVQTPGENGTRSVTYEVNMQNGKQISRKEIQSVVTKESKKQVEVIGTKSVLPPGSHQDWMAAAGIAPGDYGFVEYIVMHEGGWEPCKVQGGAINCSYAGSMGYGVVQATPGSKMGSAGDDWRTNPITQLRWATSYAVGRYGSWGGAYSHWLASHNW